VKILIGKNSDEIIGFIALKFDSGAPMTAVLTAMLGRLP
jgi:hypothetical protein